VEKGFFVIYLIYEHI